MRTTFFAVALLGMVALASANVYPVSWDSCGTRYDRLKTNHLTFDASPRLRAGATATVTTKGTADLHVPLEAGSWSVRVYEIGKAHPIYTTFGDILQALHWDDARNTTYTMTVSFTLPPKQASGNFTVSLISTDQSHGLYNCLEMRYMYSADEAQVVKAVDVASPMDGPHFWSCGGSGDKLQNLKITLDPPTPVKGKPVTISASGTVNEVVTAGTVKYKAALDGIQLISKTDNLCDLVKKTGKSCPLAKGPDSLGITVTIPSWAPSGNYSAQATAVDQNNAELTCLQGWFLLN